MALQFEPLTDDLSLQLQKLCQGAMPAGEVRVQPTGTVLTRAYQECAQQILDMEVREDDVWVISFPKCGTTWTQEMVWLLKNNLNFEKAKQTPLIKKFPFLEYTTLCGENTAIIVDSIQTVKMLKSPRLIKTHLPAELLPKQIWTKRPKIVYVHRNPKDAAISYFHHHRLLNNYEGTQELFLKAFVEDKVVFSPFWEHVLTYWSFRHQSNFIFNTFEEMKQDLPSVVRKTAKFLGTCYNEDQEQELLDHLSFASMKNNNTVNFTEKGRGSFVRQGEAGVWRKEFTPQLSRMFEEWTTEKLKDTNFPAPY